MTVTSFAALYVGNRWGMLAETHRGVSEGLASSLSADLALDILLRPLALSTSAVALICGLSLLLCVGRLRARAQLARQHEERRRARHGQARHRA